MTVPVAQSAPPIEASRAEELVCTVPVMFQNCVARYGDRPFVEVVGDITETYSQTWEHVIYMARCLQKLGVCEKQAVLIMLPNSHQAVHAWLAANQLNAIDVSINASYRGPVLVHAANLSSAAILITTSEHLSAILAVEEDLTALRTVVLMDTPSTSDLSSQTELEIICYRDLQPDLDADLPPNTTTARDIGSIIYTSGTSGPAKAVMLPHGQITLLAKRSAENTDLREDDIFFSFYPMHHMAGKFMSVLATLLTGGKVVLDTGFKPDEWLSKIREHDATITAAHGPMLEMVHALPSASDDTDHSLRLIRTAPFPKRIAVDFERRFGVRCIEVWGMTELGIVCWSDHREPLRVGSCGRVDETWFELSVVDPETDMPVHRGSVGELVVRPRAPWTIMQGYLGMPDETITAWQNLWFHTGDCGYIDNEGYVYFVDRIKERIRRRAENISASDIEAIALTHPAIREAAAVGVPSGLESDDDIMLCYVTEPGLSPDPVDILKFILRSLPHFMVPRYLCNMASLPRTITGKLQRSALKPLLDSDTVWDRKKAGVALRTLAT